MTADEVIWFVEHKYGKQSMLCETKDMIKIFTEKSVWFIMKDDYKKFRKYSLFHSNNTTKEGFHFQMTGYTIPYLVYCAVLHDYEFTFATAKTWDAFQHSYELYMYGQALWKNVCKWDEECGLEAYVRGEYDEIKI